MKILFIFTVITLVGCTSISKRELTPLNENEVKQYQPTKSTPAKVYIYGDLGLNHAPYMRVDLTTLIRTKLLSSGYFSSVEVVNVETGPVIYNQETFYEMQSLNNFFKINEEKQGTVVTIYFREIEQEVSLGFVLKMMGSVLTLGLVPNSQTSQFITGIRIYEPQKKHSLDRVYRENLEATTTSLPLSGYKFGMDHLYEPVADALMIALADYSKAGGWRD